MYSRSEASGDHQRGAIPFDQSVFGPLLRVRGGQPGNQLTQEPTSRLIRLELDAVRAQAEDLRGEVAEYERLRSGSVSTFEAASLADLPTLLVKARIARGWSHRRLGEALGVAEQQVQRYESSGYRSASLARICDVATALGVTMTERAELRDPNAA